MTYSVNLKKASKTDPKYSLTIRSSDLFGHRFKTGDKVFLEFENGEFIPFYATRGGTTLYSGKLKKHLLPLPKIGSPKEVRVVKVYEVK